MVYEHPTGHVIRTSNWAQTLPPEQRPTFTQVASLAETAQQVNAVWKFALTHDDLPQLQHFAFRHAVAQIATHFVMREQPCILKNIANATFFWRQADTFFGII